MKEETRPKKAKPTAIFSLQYLAARELLRTVIYDNGKQRSDELAHAKLTDLYKNAEVSLKEMVVSAMSDSMMDLFNRSVMVFAMTHFPLSKITNMVCPDGRIVRKRECKIAGCVLTRKFANSKLQLHIAGKTMLGSRLYTSFLVCPTGTWKDFVRKYESETKSTINDCVVLNFSRSGECFIPPDDAPLSHVLIRATPEFIKTPVMMSDFYADMEIVEPVVGSLELIPKTHPTSIVYLDYRKQPKLWIKHLKKNGLDLSDVKKAKKRKSSNLEVTSKKIKK